MVRKIYLWTIVIVIFISQALIAAPIARVVKINGNVSIAKITDKEEPLSARAGMAIDNGDLIRVERASFAVVIYLDDKSIVKVKENTQFQFVDTENTRTLEMEIGTIINNVNKEGRSKTFRVQTPTSVASVKGTKFAVLVDASGIDQFFGQEGVFEVFNLASGQTVSVGAGEKALSSSSGNVISAPAAATEFPADPDPGANPAEMEELIELFTPEPGEEALPEDIPDEVIQEKIEEITQPKSEQPAPEPEPEPEPSEQPQAPQGKPYGLGFGIGSVTIDGAVYNQLALRPELKFGKLGLGFDLVIYLDNEGNIRPNEWDEFTDLVDKFLYVRWAKKGDPFWIKVGALENVTIGYGGLMAGYSNMMEFPSVRKIGLNGGAGFGAFGLELFLSDFKDLANGGTILGARGSYTVSDNFPLTFGANIVADINQFSGFRDSDDDSYPDVFDDYPEDGDLWNDTDGDGLPDPHPGIDTVLWDKDADQDNIIDPWGGGNDLDLNLKNTPFSIRDNKASAMGYSLDVGYPIMKNKLAQMTLYAEWNHLSFPEAGTVGSEFYRPVKEGDGFTVPGLRATIFKILNISFEYRMKNGYFVPQFFDRSYDVNRVIPLYDDMATTILTKDMNIFAAEGADISLSGYFGSAGLNLFDVVSLKASYTAMTKGEQEYNSMFAELEVAPDLIPKLSEARAYYQRNNDPDPFDFKNPSVNTILGYRAGYEIASGVSLIWDYRVFYRDDGSGELAPVKQTTIETAFNL